MENTSPFLAMQQLERELKNLLRQIDVDSLDIAERRALSGIRQLALDTKLDIRDYELSETRQEQLAKLRLSKQGVDELRGTIIAASYAFGPADVAQLSAQLEQINQWIE